MNVILMVVLAAVAGFVAGMILKNQIMAIFQANKSS